MQAQFRNEAAQGAYSVNNGRLSAFGALDPVKQAAAEHRLGLGISRISDNVIELNRVYPEIIQIIVRVNIRRSGFAAVHARRIHGIQEIRRADAAAAGFDAACGYGA